MKYVKLLLLFLVLGCTKDYEILESIDGLILSANEPTRIINQSTVLSLKKNNGTDVTDEAVFYVNGEEITSNIFTKTEPGTYTINAKYKGFEATSSIQILYHDGSLVAYKSNVMVEDYTGVWCGNCPRVVHALDLASQQLGTNSNQLIKVAIHRSSSNPQDASYDPYNFDSSPFEPPGGYPKAFINRTTRWTPLEYNNLGMVVNPTQTSKKLGLKIDSSTTGGTVNVSVSGVFAQDFTNVKLVVYVLENGFIYDQVNYTAFYNGDDIIEDFIHDHVLKQILTNPNGDAIENTTIGTEFTRSFSIPVSSLVYPNDAEFVAFFVNAQGEVLNARSAKINTSQDFQNL